MPFHLARAIRNRLEADLESLYLPVPDSGYGRPRVFLGGLPAKKPDEADLPCVVIVPVSGEESEGGQPRLVVTETLIRLVCLVMGNESDERPVEAAHHTLWNLVAWVGQSLLKPGALEDRYRLVLPLTWEFREPEPSEELRIFPYSAGVIECRWQEVRVRPVLTPAEEEAIHGSGPPFKSA